MTLELSAEQLQAITAHAESTYPDECCGILLGKLGANHKALLELRAMENAWENQTTEDLTTQPSLTKSRRYSIAPDAMLEVMRYARSQNLDVVGIYHSHPDHPAVPSECDRQMAWQHYSYIIVSVNKGTASDCRSWTLNDCQQFQPEDLLVIESSNR